MAITREEFGRRLGESGLFAGEELRALLAGLAGEQGLDDGEALACHLVRAGRLTPFQAEAVAAGRYEGLLVGNYVVLEHLGAGGMGTVYKARHRRMKRDVALKVLRGEAASGTFARRFEREVETIAQLSHPNVVMAFDAGEAEVGPYLVMEFVDGRDLGAEVRLGGPLSVAEAVDATIQAARGLDYAHRRGFVHRDVKPANLLRDRAGLVKVADLGLARLEGPGEATDAVTLAGNIVGTAEYMAPEQAFDASSIGPPADIYALGGTLFFLLTGRPPYEAGSLMAQLLKHREAPIPSIRDARPEVPDALDAIFRRMVAKRPEDRYATMAEVVAALEGVRGATSALVDRPGPAAGPGRESTTPTLAVDDTGRTPPPGASATTEMATSDLGPAPAGRPLAGLSVVVVEPSRFQAGVVRRYLAELGIDRIATAGSGAEAFEAARRERADAIVSALHLPDTTGVELAGRLRADPELARVGFVLASSESDGGRSGDFPAGPGTALLPKPFDRAALADALTRTTGRDSAG